ncbi:MAG: helix-turn-helix transcriptional regulator [Anaerolineales bacterium]|jgi:putative transcriptional regulator|nr:helix-turn-helix transcriptional regulator [Anaerolineales bacterium]
MAKEKINNHIRKLRFEQGEMTQQELANLCGCTRQTIIALEQERYVPSLILAIKIARVFGKTVDDIFQLPDDGNV